MVDLMLIFLIITLLLSLLMGVFRYHERVGYHGNIVTGIVTITLVSGTAYHGANKHHHAL